MFAGICIDPDKRTRDIKKPTKITDNFILSISYYRERLDKTVKISASQVWLGSYASSHLISSYIYVAYGHILAGTIKTINYISTGYKLRFRRDYNWLSRSLFS
jgi:hypothetical protein